MKQKPNTPMREIRRKYEETHKEARKESRMSWGTTVDRKFAEEINEFLDKNNITKSELICAGYYALKEHYEKQRAEIDKLKKK